MSRYAIRKRADHVAAAQALRAAPCEWQTVHVYATRSAAIGTAWHVRRPGNGLFAYRPAGAFEARVEMVDGGTALLARYVGGAA
ncbi:hypothetical protein [Streptomyces sp. NPDC051577]|uniref:hypothetical protein n=1 Tax=Streptomyces sp. NPDC051577 TaxID=3155166 RepID=UPI003427478E